MCRPDRISVLSLVLSVAACSSGTPTAPTDAGAGDATAADGAAPDVTTPEAGADAPAEAEVDAGPGAPATAMKKFFAGDTDRDGGTSPIAWKAFGRDIDGKVTTKASTDVCTPVAGAGRDTQVDGDNGIDNAFGSRLVPIIQTFASNYGDLMNQALATSTFNFLARTDATAAFYSGSSLLGPRFDGTDRWPVAYESVDQGDANQPKVRFPQAAMNGQRWSSGDTSASAVLEFPLFPGIGIPFKVNKLQITMTLSPDGKTASNGVISGVFPTADFVAAFRQYAPAISSSLCNGSALDSISQQIQQASDILSDGTQDPNKECDGISFGFGFDGVQVSLGKVAGPVSPPANLCE
jgi:hypothetical protein